MTQGYWIVHIVTDVKVKWFASFEEALRLGAIVEDDLAFCCEACQDAYEPPSGDKPLWLP